MAIFSLICYIVRIKQFKNNIKNCSSKIKSETILISSPEEIIPENCINYASAPLECNNYASAPFYPNLVIIRTDETVSFDRESKNYCDCAGECNNRRCICIRLNKNCTVKCHFKLRNSNKNCTNI